MTTLIEAAQKLITCMRLDRIEAGDWPDDSREAYYELKQAIAQEQSKQALAQQETNPWQDAVIDQLVVHHIYQAAHDADPRKAINDLLCISNDIALDPQISSDAQALIDRGRREVQQEQPALSDEDFYKIVRPFYGTDEACKMALPMSIDEFRSIEAHCRGGVTS